MQVTMTIQTITKSSNGSAVANLVVTSPGTFSAGTTGGLTMILPNKADLGALVEGNTVTVTFS